MKKQIFTCMILFFTSLVMASSVAEQKLNHKMLKAVMAGDLAKVKQIHNEDADIHVLKDVYLRLASKDGHLDIVKYLVENGADIHAFDDWAIRLAIKKGHLDIVKYLKKATK